MVNLNKKGYLQTLEAVIAFQEKYSTEILAPWQLNRGTGFVGSTTIKKLNQLFSRIFIQKRQGILCCSARA